MHNIDIIKHRRVFLGEALGIVIVSWLCVLLFGLQPGADLSGGVSWKVRFDATTVSAQDVEYALDTAFHVSAQAARVGDDIVIRMAVLPLEERTAYEEALTQSFGTMRTLSFSDVGPTVGRELWRRSSLALVGVLVAITLFVAWAFRKASSRISSWKYALAALAALFHDVSVPLGAAALFGRFGLFEVDTTVLVGLLVVLGFSVNDTIVVFDRIREHLLEQKNERIPLGDVINRSVRETLMRSINTSGTLVVVLLALLIFGPASLHGLMLVVLIGTVAGTYSSIFVASPLLYAWQRERRGCPR